MQNEAQYDLDRKAAKISALSSNNSDKYEYLTGEYLGLKPSTIEQAKFEYSPLGKIFNKGLSEDDKKEGLFKRLKSIEGKSEVQLQAIKDQGEKQLKEIKIINRSPMLKESEGFKLSAEGKKISYEETKTDKGLDTAELVCTKTYGKTKYGFNIFTSPLKFAEKISTVEFTSQEAKDDQAQLEILINKLDKEDNPKIKRKIDIKERGFKICRKIVLCERGYY